MSLNLTIDDYDENSQEVDQRAFRILRDFLQPDSAMSLSTAYSSLLQILPDPEDDLKEEAIRDLADEFIDLASQIPYSHPAQMKLARTLQYMASSPKVLSPLGGPLRRFSESIIDNLQGPDPKNPAGYPNFHSFLAKVGGIILASKKDPTWTLWTLRHALEEDAEDAASQAERDAYVLGAAQHILFRGLDLIQWVAYPGITGNSQQTSWRPGSKYSGSSELNLERWLFWRDSFRAAAQSSTDEEVRSVAEKTVALMNALQAAMPGLG